MIDKKIIKPPTNKVKCITLDKSIESFKMIKRQGSIIISDTIFDYILEKLFSNDIMNIRSKLQYAKEIIYKFGTKEWADKNFNTHYACMHACWNCYAWNEAYQRQRQYWKDWGVMMTKRSLWNKKWKKRENNYWIMYPTTHDIIPKIMDECFQAIQHMLDANINVLCVTKPCKKVVNALIKRFLEYRKDQPRIKIRMTIGTDDDTLLSFWEPKAPSFQERFESLKVVFEAGYETSVSCEPFYPCVQRKGIDLEIKDFENFVVKLLPYVKETLWIGMMNHIPVICQRGKILTDFQKDIVFRLKDFYNLENIKYLIRVFYKNKKIRWKESIKKIIISSIMNSKI